jgi:ADP-ribosylglycohydrolase/protein-tyrosine phosphatase
MERLQRLLAAGITYFIDLTEPGELPAYDTLLPTERTPTGRYVMYARKPIHDHSIPAADEAMREILEYVDRALAGGHVVYVHCRAGIGRTGTVMGCYLVHRGLAADAALRRLNELWLANERAVFWPQTPETDEQVEYVRRWRGPAPEIGRSELAAARSLRDRYHGALLGLAIGDALGASVQFRRPGSFPPVSDLQAGGPFDLPRGAWTDDTAMALCLAESLLECQGFDAGDQVERYRRWQREGHLSSTGQCLGITASVSRALAAAQWRGTSFAGSHDPSRIDKEPLARVAAAVLYFLPNPEQAIEMAADSARTTHQAPVVLDACRLFAALLIGALQGVPKNRLLSPGYTPVPGLWERKPLKPAVEAIAAGSYRTRSAAQLDGGGTILTCLESVLWAVEKSSNFRAGALLAVNLGLDADVTGAAYGQFAGALHGVANIPQGWNRGIMQRDLLSGFADRLLSAALVRMAEPPAA